MLHMRHMAHVCARDRQYSYSSSVYRLRTAHPHAVAPPATRKSAPRIRRLNSDTSSAISSRCALVSIISAAVGLHGMLRSAFIGACMLLGFYLITHTRRRVWFSLLLLRDSAALGSVLSGTVGDWEH